MEKRQFTVSIILSFAAFFSLSSNMFEVNACVGARPMSMGGAFVAVSDDVNSIYWNPAGFGRIEGFELTYTRLMNNRDDFNYDDYAGVAGENFGIGYIHTRYKYEYQTTIDQKTKTINERDTRGSLNIGSGAAVIPERLSLGMNNKILYHRLQSESDSSEIDVSDDAVAWAFDLGLLLQITPELSIGALFQDINEPELTLHKYRFKIKYVRNLRPGVAWNIGGQLSNIFEDERIPDVTVAVDMYDALDNTEHRGRELMFGMEASVLSTESHEVQVRTGSYLMTNSDSRAYTAGIGYEHKWGFKLDYANMDWDKADKQNHLVSVGWRF